jgi:hypothetical protein
MADDLLWNVANDLAARGDYGMLNELQARKKREQESSDQGMTMLPEPPGMTMLPEPGQGEGGTGGMPTGAGGSGPPDHEVIPKGMTWYNKWQREGGTNFPSEAPMTMAPEPGMSVLPSEQAKGLPVDTGKLRGAGIDLSKVDMRARQPVAGQPGGTTTVAYARSGPAPMSKAQQAAVAALPKDWRLGFGNAQFDLDTMLNESATAELQGKSEFVGPDGKAYRVLDQRQREIVSRSFKDWQADPMGGLVPEARKRLQEKELGVGELGVLHAQQKNLIEQGVLQSVDQATEEYSKTREGNQALRAAYQESFGKRMRAQQQRLEDKITELENFKVDPWGYTLIGGPVGKMFAVIGMALGGAAAAITGQNPGLQTVKVLMDAHMQAAGQQLEAKKSGVSSGFKALDYMWQEYGEKDKTMAAYDAWLAQNYAMGVQRMRAKGMSQMAMQNSQQLEEMFMARAETAKAKLNMLNGREEQVKAIADAKARARASMLMVQQQKQNAMQQAYGGRLLNNGIPLMTYNPKSGKVDMKAQKTFDEHFLKGPGFSLWVNDPKLKHAYSSASQILSKLKVIAPEIKNAQGRLDITSFKKLQELGPEFAQIKIAAASTNDPNVRALASQFQKLEKQISEPQNFASLYAHGLLNWGTNAITDSDKLIDEDVARVEKMVDSMGDSLMGAPVLYGHTVDPVSGQVVQGFEMIPGSLQTVNEARKAAAQSTGRPQGGAGDLDISHEVLTPEGYE